MKGKEERSKGIEILIANAFDIIKPTTPFKCSDQMFIMNREIEVKRRLVNQGRCDERLKDKVEESTCLVIQT